MKILFWFLDINEKITEKGSEIRLWGLDDNSRRILMIDRSFLPYL